MRNPNGYGAIVNLGKNRRKPYGIRKVEGWTEQGKPIYKYYGFYETREQAMLGLAQVNMTPQEKYECMTFEEVVGKWKEHHYPRISTNSIKVYEGCFNGSSSLYGKTLTEIRQSDLQAVLDNYNGYSTKNQYKSFFSNVYKYAESQEIIPMGIDRTKYLDVGVKVESTKHIRFTYSELTTMWEHSDNPEIALLLVLCYTGCRPMELFSLTSQDIEEDYFIIRSGKTKNAARTVPLHKSIRSLFKKNMRYDIVSVASYNAWARKCVKALDDIGISNHTVYDTRHTFTSMWKDNKLDEAMRRKIQGHSSEGIGEKVYTHFDIDILIEEVNKLPIEFRENLVRLRA